MTLIVQRRALDSVAALRPTLTRLRRLDKSLFDQLRRAASSVVLNIAEADGSDPGNARSRFATACGSAKEARAALSLAVALGYVQLEQTAVADSLLDEVCAITWRLSGR